MRFNKRIFSLMCFLLFSYSCVWLNKSKYEIDKLYYDNGTIEAIVSKKNGMLNGVSYYYDIDSNLISSANYMNDLLHGQWIEYYLNGQKKSESNYNNGLEDGKWYAYYENGRKKSLKEWRNG